MPQNILFCFGYGYSASALTKTLRSNKWIVKGTKRDKLFQNKNFRQILIFNGDNPIPKFEELLSNVTHLLVSIPPTAIGDPVLSIHGKEISNAKNLKWIGYLSTTGVYGDSQGKHVDEKYQCNPTNMRSKRRLHAEKEWLQLFSDLHLPVHIFRLAGIYGPGRSAIESVRSGRAKRINVPGHQFSRIHVDDIASVLKASIKDPNPGCIYNVCDNESAASSDVTLYACELLGLSPPPLIDLQDAELSPMARSFYNDNRRVDNKRIREELKVELKYPTYREGLKSIIETQKKNYFRN